MCTGEIGLPVDPENWTCLVYISFAQVWLIFKPSTFGNWYTNFDANQDLRMVLWTEHKDCTAKLKTWRESTKRWTHLAQPIGCPFIVRQKVSNIWGSQSLEVCKRLGPNRWPRPIDPASPRDVFHGQIVDARVGLVQIQLISSQAGREVHVEWCTVNIYVYMSHTHTHLSICVYIYIHTHRNRHMCVWNINIIYIYTITKQFVRQLCHVESLSTGRAPSRGHHDVWSHHGGHHRRRRRRYRSPHSGWFKPTTPWGWS